MFNMPELLRFPTVAVLRGGRCPRISWSLYEPLDFNSNRVAYEDTSNGGGTVKWSRVYWATADAVTKVSVGIGRRNRHVMAIGRSPRCSTYKRFAQAQERRRFHGSDEDRQN